MQSLSEYMRLIPIAERRKKAAEIVDSCLFNRSKSDEAVYQLTTPSLYPKAFEEVVKYQQYTEAISGICEWVLFEVKWIRNGEQMGYRERIFLCSRLNDCLKNPLPIEELAELLVEIIATHKSPKEELLQYWEKKRRERLRPKIREYTETDTDAEEADIERILDHIRKTTAAIDSLPTDQQKEQREKRLTMRAIRSALGWHKAAKREAGNRAITAIRARGLVREIQADKSHKSYIVEIVKQT